MYEQVAINILSAYVPSHPRKFPHPPSPSPKWKLVYTLFLETWCIPKQNSSLDAFLGKIQQVLWCKCRYHWIDELNIVLCDCQQVRTQGCFLLRRGGITEIAWEEANFCDPASFNQNNSGGGSPGKKVNPYDHS